MADIHVINHGSIVLLEQQDRRAELWLEQNVDPEANLVGTCSRRRTALRARHRQRRRRGRTGGAVMRCKRCNGTKVVLDRIFPGRRGLEYHRYRCEDCGHFRSKSVRKVR
jgi:hypothetical protein